MSRQRLRDLVAHEESVREEERRTVARMLHDELGQLLTSIKLELGALTELVRSSARALFRGSRRSAAVGGRPARRLHRDGPARLGEGPAGDARPARDSPEALRSEALLFETRTRIRCRVSVSPPKLEIDPERASMLYRILLEALTNVARHAAAGAVQISLKKDGGVVCCPCATTAAASPSRPDRQPADDGAARHARARAGGGRRRSDHVGRKARYLVMATLPLPPAQPSAVPAAPGPLPA